MAQVNRHFNVAFMIKASDQDHHLTIMYLKNVSEQEKQQALNLYRQFVEENVVINVEGLHLLDYSSVKPWGKNSVLVEGTISKFKEDLDQFLLQHFKEKLSIRKAHVDVKGKFDTKLFPAFNMMDLTMN